MRFACERKKRVLCAAMRVDLNPARAAMCDTLAESDHTTIQRRLREREQLTKRRLAGKNPLDHPLKPVAGLDADALLGMTESSYIALVQWTGEQARSDKRGKLQPSFALHEARPERFCRRGGLRQNAVRAALFR